MKPLSARRIGRLGQIGYGSIRDIQQATEIQSGRGDEAIIDEYDTYDEEHRAQVLLFSNDRNFVEMARGHTLLRERIEFISELPRKTDATWEELELLLYLVATIFGIVEVPATTVHGVWRGKEGTDWQQERLKLDCRSPNLRSELEDDLAILESYEDINPQ